MMASSFRMLMVPPGEAAARMVGSRRIVDTASIRLSGTFCAVRTLEWKFELRMCRRSNHGLSELRAEDELAERALERNIGAKPRPRPDILRQFVQRA